MTATNPYRPYVQDVWAIALLLACFIWGGGPEKASIGVWLMVFSTSSAFSGFVARDTVEIETMVAGVLVPSFIADAVALVGFVAVALFANRQYVIWLAAWQIVAVMSHAIRAMEETTGVFTYALMYLGPGWMQIWIITGALIAYRRRQPNRFADWRWQVARSKSAKTSPLAAPQ